ncbi:MAG TPA: hypothetical protein PLP57_04245 [Candidatus Saccharicenans sp.]|nr:hypothetical protein [Candidatus Saccharicenans sp.]
MAKLPIKFNTAVHSKKSITLWAWWKEKANNSQKLTRRLEYYLYRGFRGSKVQKKSN